MLYYSKMRWKLDGMSFEDLWKLEDKEAHTAVDSIRQGIVKHLYKVCAEQYVVSIGGTDTVEDFDRYADGILPMREHLIFEEVLPLTEAFTIDIFPYLKARRDRIKDEPKLLHQVEFSWPGNDRNLDANWAALSDRLAKLKAPLVLGLYRCAGRQKAIAIIDVTDAREIDSFAALPEMAGSTIDKVWALRDYIGFADDVAAGYRFGA